ncbi:hypothetical protein [Dinoroseobacter sp. S124A]|uniref:hypothetical protein n=1 Tax=Dinoroseobacter sp. S124A TaxID=3415128 RepID=UPI003C79C83A
MTLCSVLIATNQFARWAGSEMVATEFAEAFRDRGFDVTLFTNAISSELAGPLLERGVTVTDRPEDVNLWQHDLVYCQHSVFARLFEKPVPKRGAFPVFVFNHLSPYAPLEVPGPHFEKAFGDIILTNSPETRSALVNHDPDLEARAEVFPNPAPASFQRGERPPREALRRLLCVSNHVPTEMRHALRHLEKAGVAVVRVGRKDTPRRISPTDFDGIDAVVSIGKTVQYALAARVPVFCYDRFGGPGWLSHDNFEAAAEANFSGRCMRNPREAEVLAAELLSGFAEADRFAVGMPEELRSRFFLDPLLTSVLKRAEILAADEMRSEVAFSKLAGAEWKARLEEERALAETARRDFLTSWRDSQKLDRRRQRRRRLKRLFRLPQ